MSYSIMYASQFIRTETGITPCILAGSNNVWEAGNKRRVRNWSCFRNLVDVSAERLMKEAESMIGSEYQEHWKANNKWVDDAGLMRWMKSKIKGAATVEDIMMANPDIRFIHCYASVWSDLRQEIRIDTYIHNSAEFVEWVASYRKIQKDVGTGIYAVVDFGTEKIRVPTVLRSGDEKFLLKRRGLYLIKVEDTGLTFSSDIHSALELSYEQSQAIIKNHRIKPALVKAENKHLPYNAVIKVTQGTYAGSYIKRVTRKDVRYTYNVNQAKRYPTTSAAEKARKKIEPKVAGSSYAVISI